MKHTTLDEAGSLEYNREEILIRPDGSLTVSAVLHRPLRAARPWSFGFPGVCPEAYEETEGRCVPHQLEAVLERTLGLKASNMDWLFDEISDELYPPNSEHHPFDLERGDGSIERRTWRQCGITVAMIQKFAEVHTMSVHVLFGSMKVLSFTPENAVTSVCMHVHGDHAFFVNDPHTKGVIAKMKLTKPEFRPDVVLKVPPKNPDADISASEWLPWSGNVACEPGHYYTEDLGSARVAFHTKGLCPQVQLNSSCIPKALRMKTSAGSVVIHKLGADASVCQVFSTEFEAETGTPLPWMGGSLATLL